MKTAWFHILLSLGAQDRYGSAIQEDISETTGGRIRLWPASLYGSLEDLADRGWIRELRQTEQSRGISGRVRFYRITSRGRRALEKEIARLEELVRLGRSRLAATAPEPAPCARISD